MAPDGCAIGHCPGWTAQVGRHCTTETRVGRDRASRAGAARRGGLQMASSAMDQPLGHEHRPAPRLLPGWLYLQFIAVKGTGLYDEYVLNLYRLRIDDVANLPKPPPGSRYWAWW